VGEPQLSEPNLHLGLLAIRNEFVNLSELKHCVEVRKKLFAKSQQDLSLGDVLVQQRYLMPQDLEYLRMIEEAEPPPEKPVELADIVAEFEQHVQELKPGSEFGGYRIEEEIGRGGMGIVFRAVSLEGDEQECALKILIGGKDATVRDIERFKKEATVMAPLIHPGIVKIYQVDRHKGLDYIAMEFVDGVSLKALVGDKPQPVPQDAALLVIKSAADAVGFMHGEGIIHRDIKPENIMVRPDGSAVLMDFGLAGWEKIEILSGRGSIGTPMYQPPEQADVNGPFGKISEASDVYGLGATLYYMLTGRHPFLGRSVKEVREKIKTQPPDPLRKVNPDLHAAVEGLVLRCLRKRQSERFGTPRELSENIDKVLSLLGKGDKGAKAETRLLRRIAKATRLSGVGAVSGVGKRTSALGKVRGPSGVGKRTATSVKTKGPAKKRPSAGGKVKRSSPSRKSDRPGAARGRPRRGTTSDLGPAKKDNTPLIIAAVLTVIVGLIIGAIALS
jgi:serine/threonine protein kinase